MKTGVTVSDKYQIHLKKVFSVVKISKSPANIYLLKVKNRSARKRCEICSKLTIKTLEQCR